MKARHFVNSRGNFPIQRIVLSRLYFPQEQVEWAVEEKADYIVGETFDSYGEAKLALDAILKYGAGTFTSSI